MKQFNKTEAKLIADHLYHNLDDCEKFAFYVFGVMNSDHTNPNVRVLLNRRIHTWIYCQITEL